MQTKNIIQTQANVIKITSLVKGNVVKIIDDSSSYSTDIKYGVVIDLMNDGSKTFLEILEYKKSYGDVSAEIKLYSGDKELNLFPASVDEVKEYFETTLSYISKSIEQDKENLQKKINGFEKAKQFVSGELSKNLLETSFVEMTQADFDAKKMEREKLLSESSF